MMNSALAFLEKTSAFLNDIPWFIYVLLGGVILLLIIGIIWSSAKHKRKKFDIDAEDLEDMDGRRFEEYCAGLLNANGFENIELTPASSDFGVDIFAEKDGLTYAFQCKLYDHPVGTKAVQEIYSGRDFYHCMIGVVLTNQSFTSGAYKLAEAFNILLWGDDMLAELESNVK